MFKRAAVLAVSCGAALSGCGTDDPRIENEQTVSNLVEAGFPASDIRIFEDAVYVGNDAHVSLQASQEMLQPGEGSQEHYRTTNVVSKSLTKICINPTATFNSYARLSEGLNLAIANYNALGLCFTFVRGPSTGCSANITATTMPGVSGSSGFPSGGRPYGQISIGTGLNSYSADMNEYVITHELGHAFGLRHSDFYYQAVSCNTGGNEGTAGIGAIHIPGTPTTATYGGSIMNACPRNPETGEFTSTDIIALTALYKC